ncbi:MAG: hypothetical protein CMH29_00805 [Micavibrio sp.]|nr:hypothetical protein [Micavibrio sp.]|tara:strand:- start:796 stop:1101 length:306 start_codon:yes stop_codon:yes gene_type:complete
MEKYATVKNEDRRERKKQAMHCYPIRQTRKKLLRSPVHGRYPMLLDLTSCESGPWKLGIYRGGCFTVYQSEGGITDAVPTFKRRKMLSAAFKVVDTIFSSL